MDSKRPKTPEDHTEPPEVWEGQENLSLPFLLTLHHTQEAVQRMLSFQKQVSFWRMRQVPSQLLLVIESTSCVLIHPLFRVLNYLIHRRISLNPSFGLLCWVWYSFCTEEILVKPELFLFFMVLQAMLTFGEYQRIHSAWRQFSDLPANTGFLRNLEHC